ncbi:sigma-54-dependent transcriptional regulator [Tautonia plasticadhaerens]|nr:sigma 54-interacting transcriptional regulator [Tautonia plasticadhaerens]
MEGGAFDYLVKPFDLDQAAAVLSRALEVRPPGSRGPAPPLDAGDDALIGNSPAMQDLFKQIALVAPTDVPVLITGESGTGKELVARAIHRHSPRRPGPFLPICLAALSPSLVERELFGHLKGSFTGADHDRKGLLELASAARSCSTRSATSPGAPGEVAAHPGAPRGHPRRRCPPPADLRIVAATNRPLGDLMSSGQFRHDLFFRLSVFPIHLPPLRDRAEDVPALAEHFLRRSRVPDAAGLRLDPDALRPSEPAPGPATSGSFATRSSAPPSSPGVRRSAPTTCPAPVRPGPVVDRLPGRLRPAARRLGEPGGGPTPGRTQRPRPLRSVPRPGRAAPPPRRPAACNGNRARAARLLGIHRSTLRQKLSRHEIS